MTTKIMATVLAATIALTSFTAVPAAAKPSDGVRILQGLAALYIISRVVKHNKRQRPATIAPVVPRQLVPYQCLQTYYTPDGMRRAFGARCVGKYAPRLKLPPQCKSRIWTDAGRRDVFGPNCLREYGHKISVR